MDPAQGGVLLALPRRGPASIVGPRVTPLRTVVRGGDVFWGVHFWPGTGASLLGLAKSEWRERRGLARSELDPSWIEPLTESLDSEDDEEVAAVAYVLSLAEGSSGSD